MKSQRSSGPPGLTPEFHALHGVSAALKAGAAQW
jgi:hypothetical protein